ncbi:MAG: hypothetical protein Kow0031_32390 [Anaerolineae bacterium]
MLRQATSLFLKALVIGVLLSVGIQWVSDSPQEVATKMQRIQQLETAEVNQPPTTHSLKPPR